MILVGTSVLSLLVGYWVGFKAGYGRAALLSNLIFIFTVGDLIQAGLLSEEDLKKALSRAKKSAHKKLGIKD
jgi:hypothetical protein